MIRRVALFALCALALLPQGGRADVRGVSMTGNKFVPAVRSGLVAGDQIVFSWLDGTHHVAAIQNGDFDSGTRTEGDEFLLDYTGGIVRYRCTLHSRLTNGFECSGMCGVLTDRPLETVRPTATIDAAPQVVPPSIPPGPTTPVTLTGTAKDDSSVYGALVRIYDTAGIATEHMAACTDCGTTAATWKLDVSLPLGSYVAEAVAVDDSGNVSETFPRTSFIVL